MFHWRAEILPGVSAAFTDTDAGNLALHVGDDASEVQQRRARLEQAMGIAPRSLRFMNQVHGSTVAAMEPDSAVPEADAMVSGGPCPTKPRVEADHDGVEPRGRL